MSKYHDILGIPKGATKQAVKRAFRKQAMKWHPDKNDSLEASDIFQKINEAYEYLAEGKVPIEHYSYNTPKSYKSTVSTYDKYKNVYVPPTDPVERAKWQAVQNQVRNEIKAKNYEDMLKEHAAFQKSPWFEFYYFLFWVLKLIFFGIGLLFLYFVLIPFVFGDIVVGVILAIVSSIAFYFLYQMYLYFENDMGAMFKDRE